jgi:hypothetical protein
MVLFVFWAVALDAGERDSVQFGREIFYGKGRCGICHTIGVEHGGKCPNLDGAGTRLTRNFIYEAMINPSAYVKLDFDTDSGVEEPNFYSARMPQVTRPPIGLAEKEIQNVIAFIGSQRGTSLPGVLPPTRR